MKLPTVLSDGFIKALPEEEREKHRLNTGFRQVTKEEAQTTYQRGEERKLQILIAQWLNREKHYFVRPRMDKKTTTAKGTPDFIVCVKDTMGHGRFVCIEAKTKQGSLSMDQMGVMAEATLSGAAYCVARCLEDVIKMIGYVKGTKP